MASIINAATSGGLVTTADTSGILQLQTAGTTAVTVDASQNVGIGTASPTNKVSIVTASGSDGIVSVKSPLTETAGVVIDGGTSSNKGAVLKFSKNASVLWQMGTDSAIIGSTSDNFHLYGGGANAILFSTNATERARIDSSGNFLIGKTSKSNTSGNGFQCEANGTINVVTASSNASFDTYEIYSTGAGAYRFYVTAGGVINATSTSITAISDQRLKENVRDIDTGLNAIMALKPRRFDWKEGKGQDKKDVAGFIAQEFETVFPECVGTTKAGADGIEYKNINHETLLPTLVKALQEQQALITQLQADVAALKGN